MMRPEPYLDQIDKMAKAMSRRSLRYQDRLQELVLAFLELPENGKPFKYHLKAAMNKSIDAFKSRRYNYSYNDRIGHVDMNTPDLPIVEVDFDTSIQANIMLASCSDEDRELLYRYFWLGETQDEVAEVYGVTRSLISKRITTILQKLRETYEVEPVRHTQFRAFNNRNTKGVT
ncbi:hypothetical protein LCGC14_2896850 [marine sediment metagenome]|uniref:RNA polymerase sigma-70 region 4 domain-containing protein n=1 Tax=marine sediment metagenome TaxID=412755 RepID=A0A0F9A3G6_9ZZZZ